MLSTDTNIRFYNDPRMCQLPIGLQSEVMDIFGDIISGLAEERPDAVLSELLSDYSQSRGEYSATD